MKNLSGVEAGGRGGRGRDYILVETAFKAGAASHFILFKMKEINAPLLYLLSFVFYLLSLKFLGDS